MIEMTMPNIKIMDPSISIGQLVIYTEKNSIEFLTASHTSINSRLIKELISKLTEANPGGYILVISEQVKCF